MKNQMNPSHHGAHAGVYMDSDEYNDGANVTDQLGLQLKDDGSLYERIKRAIGAEFIEIVTIDPLDGTLTSENQPKTHKH